MHKVIYEFKDDFKAIVIAIPPGMADSQERTTSYEHFARTFQEPNKFLLYWNGMSPSRTIQEDWVTVVDVTDEEDMPEDADDTGEIPTSGHEHSIGGGMPPMLDRTGKEARQDLAAVAEIIRSRVEQDECQKYEQFHQLNATAAAASTTGRVESRCTVIPACVSRVATAPPAVVTARCTSQPAA
jgi:hypothetical protein